MCTDSGQWNSEKKRIADRIGELTNVWHVGVKSRNHALAAGITSWKDELCTAAALRLGGKRAPIIDKIMAINRQSNDTLWPKKIQSNINGWKDQDTEVFVDFETLSDIFAGFNNLPIQKSTNMIFMIGVGWEVDGRQSSFLVCLGLLKEYLIVMPDLQLLETTTAGRHCI